MIRICFILFPFLILNTLVAQTKQTFFFAGLISNLNDPNAQDEVVYTPFGPTLKSNVHFVGNK